MTVPFWFTLTTTLGSAAWIVFLYWRQYQETARAQLITARTPFLGMQLNLYTDAAKTIGQLVTLDFETSEWRSHEARFWALYWSELCMVEDADVEEAMRMFGDQLKIYKSQADKSRKTELEDLSRNVAMAIRNSVKDGWGSETSKK
jgi:hypothetical protein